MDFLCIFMVGKIKKDGKKTTKATTKTTTKTTTPTKNYGTTFGKHSNYIVVKDPNGLKVKNVKYKKGKNSKENLGYSKRQQGKTCVIISITSRKSYVNTYLKKYVDPSYYIYEREKAEKKYNKLVIVIYGKDNKGNKFEEAIIGSQIPN